MKRCTWTPNTQDYYSGMRQIMMAMIQLRPDLYPLAKNPKEKRDTDYNIEGTTVINI